MTKSRYLWFAAVMFGVGVLIGKALAGTSWPLALAMGLLLALLTTTGIWYVNRNTAQ
jgi:uncharacterized membrane protein YccC